MKKTIVSVVALSIALGALPLYADNRDDVTIPFPPIMSHVSVETARDSERQERFLSQSLTRLKARGAHLIDTRISSLESNNKAVANSKLTVEQKATINTLVTTNVTGLNALKVSIASSTNATSTKALVESVYTQFRIYGIVIPQVRLEKRIYDLQNHVTTLSDTFLKVQTKINEYKGKGKDVAVWQKSLDDAKLLVATDVGKLSALMVQAQALKPSDYGTSSKATIDSVNAGIKVVAKDFSTIQRTLRKPSKLKDVTATTTVSVTSTTTVR